MLVYKFDEKGLFVGTDETDLDPLESKLQGKEIYLLPPNATFATPEEKEGFAPVWDGEKWKNIEDNRGREYWLPGDKYGAPARMMDEIGPLPSGAVLTPPEQTEAERKTEALAQAKTDRAEAVSKITVEFDGMTFDGDEESQQRIARSIIALGDGETMPWVLHDNTIAEVSKEQLKQVLRLAGQKQSELWVVPYQQ